MSLKLGTICKEVPCDISFEQNPADIDGLKKKLASLELFRIIKRMGLENAGEKARGASAERQIEVEPSKDAPDITGKFFPRYNKA